MGYNRPCPCNNCPDRWVSGTKRCDMECARWDTWKKQIAEDKKKQKEYNERYYSVSRKLYIDSHNR